MDLILSFCLAGSPGDFPDLANWLRGSGRRGWVQRLEVRRGCDDRRDYGCKGGFL